MTYFESIVLSKSTPEKTAVELGGECKCLECRHGCKYGSGIFKEGEEKKLAKHIGISEEELHEKYLEEVNLFNTKRYRPRVRRKGNKPFGPCIFFNEDKGLCQIYEKRPLQCKISNSHEHGEQLHAWFVLNHLVNEDDPESIRQYASYLKHKKTIPGGALHELVPDKEELKQILDFKKLK